MISTTVPEFSTFTVTTARKSSDIEIPADVLADLNRAAAYFDGQPNTVKLTAPLASDEEAALFAARVYQYGKDHGRSTTRKISGTCVTFRIAKPAKARATVSPVTVTQVTPPATDTGKAA